MHSRSTIARVIGVFGLSSLLGATSAVAEGYSFTEINVPGYRGSGALALNNVGQVVGDAANATGEVGFIWTKGMLTIVNPGQVTNLTGINDAGLAVGNDESLTFTYDTVTGQLSPVGSPAGVSLNGQAINLYGMVTGFADLPNVENDVGFIALGQKFHSFSVPHHIRPRSGFFTRPSAISNSGKVVGITYDDVTRTYAGFIYKGGLVTKVIPPNSRDVFHIYISSHDIVTGGFFLSDRIEHGYTFDGANYTVVDYPGARGTEIMSVDESGAIIGNWLGSSSLPHGFIERKGVFYSIDHPGSASTQINAVNGKNTIVGTFSTPTGGSVAFIAKCIADQPECTP